MSNGIYFKIAGQVDLDVLIIIVSGDAVHQPTWPLLLKIEHMVKLQVLGNN
jgi:predicted AAA+ superfamily ATPase